MPADSGCPSPVVRWQSEQARGSFRRPFATTDGIGGWSPGNQSGGPYGLLTSTSLYFFSLPGWVMILLASRFGAPFGATGYAQGVFSAANSIGGTATIAGPMTRAAAQMIYFIESSQRNCRAGGRSKSLRHRPLNTVYKPSNKGTSGLIGISGARTPSENWHGHWALRITCACALLTVRASAD